MKEFDKDGLLVCTLQGNVFLSSATNTESSSEIFIRRFMLSEMVKEFDSLAVLSDTLTEKDILERVENEFGETSYGKVKYEKEVLFWIGYLYRYMAYTYELTSKYIYKILKPKELRDCYYVYHTMDCSVAIARILEEKNISFDIDKQNELLLSMMKRKMYESGVTFESIHDNNSQLKNSVSEGETVYLNNDGDDKLRELNILYKNCFIGKVNLSKISNGFYELEFIITENRLKDKCVEIVAIEKAMEYAKFEFNATSLLVGIPKVDDATIIELKKLGFSYEKETENIVYYSKLI